MLIDLLEKPKSYVKLEPANPIKIILLEQGKEVRFGIALLGETKDRLIEILKERKSTLAWCPEEVTGVDLAIITNN